MTMRRGGFVRGGVVASLLVAAGIASGCGSSTPATPTTAITTSPVTESWTGVVGPGGLASHSFITSQAGTITVTLTSSDAPLGLGIGIPRAVNGGCRLATSQVDAAGLAVSAPADAGSYCVEVFDDGGVGKQAAFAVQIVYP
jgi:hypothetical protein